MFTKFCHYYFRLNAVFFQAIEFISCRDLTSIHPRVLPSFLAQVGYLFGAYRLLLDSDHRQRKKGVKSLTSWKFHQRAESG